jgi:hypothetical protein
VGSYTVAPAGAETNIGNVGTAGDVGNGRALADWLETSGYTVYYADLDLGAKGRWQRVLAGAYTDPQVAQRDADRLNALVPGANARVVDVASVPAEH